MTQPNPFFKPLLAAAVLLIAACWAPVLAQAADENEPVRSVQLKQITAGLNKFAPHKAAVTEFYNQNGKLPSSNSQLRMPAADKFRDEVIASLKIEGEGIIAVTFVKFPEVANAWIHLVPDLTPTHTLHWRCVSNIPDIDKTAAECHYYRATSESETRILQQAQTQAVTAPKVRPAHVVAAHGEPAGMQSPVRELDCSLLKRFIENKLQSNGVKNYQVNILDSSQAGRGSGKGRIVGQCNRGLNKLEYVHLPAPQ